MVIMDKNKFNLKNIIEYIKRKKLYFGVALVAVVLLVFAFLAGGELSSTPQSDYSVPKILAVSSSDEAAQEVSPSAVTITLKDKESEDKSDNTSKSKSDEIEKSKSEQSVKESSTLSDNSGSDSQSVNTDNSAKNNSHSSSGVSPYSKEYYYPVSSDSSANTSSESAPNSDSNGKDKYKTDPIPEGKPKPVEPQDQEIEDNHLTCTFSISCATILNNLDKFNPEKIELVPQDGWILKPTKVTFDEGESVYDVLVRVCKENKIHMSSRWTPIYNSHYIEAINNIKEFDCPTDRFHNTSGWRYCVNDWYPNYGVSRYELKNGDVVEFNYSCVGLGADLGADYAMGE